VPLFILTPFGFNKSLFFNYICPYITHSLFMCLCSFYPLLGSTNHFSSFICPYYQQWLSYHSLFIQDSMNIWLFQITFDLYFSHKTWVYDSTLGHLMVHSRSKPVLGLPCISLVAWTNSPVAYSRNWALAIYLFPLYFDQLIFSRKCKLYEIKLIKI